MQYLWDSTLEHGRDNSGAWLFRVSRRGEPVEGPEVFTWMPLPLRLTEYVGVTGNPQALEAAREIFGAPPSSERS